MRTLRAIVTADVWTQAMQRRFDKKGSVIDLPYHTDIFYALFASFRFEVNPASEKQGEQADIIIKLTTL